MNRRDFLYSLFSAAGTYYLTGCSSNLQGTNAISKPNVIYIFADQWRADAIGYRKDPNVHTPTFDKLETESINFTNAVSGCPVCSPYRASLLTGQYPLTHGVFLNDVPLDPGAVSIAKVYKRAGYDTAYIGKWHVDGQGRSNYIPPHRRQGFDFWMVLECTHNYNNSKYFRHGQCNRSTWSGYDAIDQTDTAVQYIKDHSAGGKPFLLFMSWGPPHAPYLTAPEKYRKRYKAQNMVLKPNVPENMHAEAKKNLAGYYAHIAALDDCMKKMLDTIEQAGIKDNTILVFTSDHGDMLYSHGQTKKQRPWEESIRVPFLLRYPAVHGSKGRGLATPINTPDIMPTLLSLSGIKIPETVEGSSYAGLIAGGKEADDSYALIMCPSPFGQWERRHGGKEYRGIRTTRYTYTRDLNGPWMLFDNQKDPYQLNNLVNNPEYKELKNKMETKLQKALKQRNDKFLPGPDYINQWNWTVDENGTVPYWKKHQIM